VFFYFFYISPSRYLRYTYLMASNYTNNQNARTAELARMERQKKRAG